MEKKRTRLASLFEFDRAVDLEGEIKLRDFESHPRRQSLMALQPAVGNGCAHRLLDLALGGDAHLLEKLAHTGIDRVFVHPRLPLPKAQKPNAFPPWSQTGPLLPV